MRRLATVLALATLALSVMDGVRPAAAQSVANEATQVLSEAQVQERRERIRGFFQNRAQRRQVVATTVTPSGQTIDWIRPESQTLDGILAQPPDDSIPDLHPDTTPLQFDPPAATAQVEGQAQTEVQRHPSARGPAGTVPVVRFDVEKYLASVKVPPEDPHEIFRKLQPPEHPQAVRRQIPSPAPDPATNRYYVGWNRPGTTYGSAGRINIWNTAGPVNNETSISQVSVIRGTTLQTVEAGKTESPLLTHDLGPHFFTYYTTNGYAKEGDWLGGHNADVDGWIQVSSTVAPGMPLVASQTGGTQYVLDVEVRWSNGNWWVKALGVCP